MKPADSIGKKVTRCEAVIGSFGVASIAGVGLIAVLLAIVPSTKGYAGPEAKRGNADKSTASSARPLPELRSTGSLAAQYCEAARDTIVEVRYEQQAAQLERLAKQADERLELLKKQSAELKEWIAKRDEFIAAATKHLVAIFGAMRPESASEQMVRLDVSTAASILSRLDVRAASAILNDMPPEKAARLTSVIAGSARKDNQEKP